MDPKPSIDEIRTAAADEGLALTNLPALAVKMLSKAESMLPLEEWSEANEHTNIAHAAATLMLSQHAGEIVKELRQLRAILTKRAES